MEMISFQVGEVTFGGETEEGVESAATDIKGCNTSWCYHTQLVLQKKFEAVDEIRFTCPCCSRNNHSQGRLIGGFRMLMYSGVHLQLFTLKV